MDDRFNWDGDLHTENIRPKRKNRFLTYLALVLVTSIVSSVAVGGTLYLKFSDELKNAVASAQQGASAATTVDKNQNLAGKLTNIALMKGSSVTEIAKKVGPSIVGIRMTVTSSRSGFYGAGTQEAEGSGIVIKKDGYIMTNYHVVQYADPKSGYSNNTVLEVFLPDKRQAKARFVGGDAVTDLAVLKIDLSNLPAAELGDSSILQVGELAVAIGNPLGMEFAGSVTAGVISALNRKVDTEALNLIQTDAAINPGNSGGALVNSQGLVIGINSAKISDTGVEGLGFAIPINEAKPIIDQLIMFGYIKGRPSIGISGQDVTSTISRIYGLPVGVYITDVTPGSGAEKAGIEAGDVLVGMAGKTVKTQADLDDIKLGYKAGDTVTVIIVRDNIKKTLKLTFTEEK